MIRYDDVYKIGRIGRTHGLHGELNMQITDDAFDRNDADYLLLEVDGILVPFFFEEYRFRTDETLLVKFEGVDTQERAHELTGCEVFFPRYMADMTDGLDGSISYSSLTGFTIVDASTGNIVGEIACIDDQTINIMFELTDGTLLPASEELIQTVDTNRRTVTLQIPDGLL